MGAVLLIPTDVKVPFRVSRHDLESLLDEDAFNVEWDWPIEVKLEPAGEDTVVWVLALIGDAGFP